MHIIHGENITTSRQQLTQLINQAKKDKHEIHHYEKKPDPTLLKQSIESQSLFAQPKTIIIENFLSTQNARSKSPTLDYLTSINTDSNLQIIFWDKKKLTPGILKKFPNSTPQEHKLPQTLFTWLDQIKPKSPQSNYQNLTKVLQDQPADLALALLTRRIRQLLILNSSGVGELKNNENIAPWQLKKLDQQSKKFPAQRLQKFYQNLYNYDQKRKTSQTTLSPESQLERWMLLI